MKYYSPEKIKDYIDKNADRIESVELGMREDWSWTAETIYANGKYSVSMEKKRVKIAGIDGSIWATPVMRVAFVDGASEIVECYEDNGQCADEERVQLQRRFTQLTGGGDSLP